MDKKCIYCKSEEIGRVNTGHYIVDFCFDCGGEW